MYTDKTNITNADKTYTISQVSKLFDVSKDTVIRMINDGRLEGYKVKNRYQITEESMKRLVMGGKKA